MRSWCLLLNFYEIFVFWFIELFYWNKTTWFVVYWRRNLHLHEILLLSLVALLLGLIHETNFYTRLDTGPPIVKLTDYIVKLVIWLSKQNILDPISPQPQIELVAARQLFDLVLIWCLYLRQVLPCLFLHFFELFLFYVGFWNKHWTIFEIYFHDTSEAITPW